MLYVGFVVNIHYSMKKGSCSLYPWGLTKNEQVEAAHPISLLSPHSHWFWEHHQVHGSHQREVRLQRIMQCSRVWIWVNRCRDSLLWWSVLRDCLDSNHLPASCLPVLLTSNHRLAPAQEKGLAWMNLWWVIDRSLVNILYPTFHFPNNVKSDCQQQQLLSHHKKGIWQKIFSIFSHFSILCEVL